jgi:HAD superfamily hydrolase (TIGR01549 family)
MIRLLSFDFWNTLVSPNPEYSKHRLALLSAFTGLDPEQAKAAYLRVKRNADTLAEVTGTSFSSYNIFRMFMHEANQPLNSEEIWRLHDRVQTLALSHPPIALPATIDALKAVRDEGYALGLVSNTNFITGTTLRSVISAWGVEFDTMVFSDEEDSSKPNARLFCKMLNGYRGPPIHAYEVMHIGDHKVCDYAGAISAGFAGYHLADVADLAPYLLKYYTTPAMESANA